MSKIDELRAKRNNLQSRTDETFAEADKIQQESLRVADVAHNANIILKNLDEEFEKKTSLNKTDACFLFLAITLQCFRIFGLNQILHIDKAGENNKIEKNLHEAQNKIFSKIKDNKSQAPHLFYAPLHQILTTPGVPFDATNTNGELQLFKGANHRFTTLAHDPLLGLVIGTANILTNTITCISDRIITTNHVIYEVGYKRPQIVDDHRLDNTVLMFKNAVNRFPDDKESIVAALIKQIIHIGTDFYTPMGIQLPFLNLICNKTDANGKMDKLFLKQNVEKITKIISTGDLIKAGISYKIACLIDMIISTVHTLSYDENNGYPMELHSVKTRKILLYSNLIATGSNIIQVGFSAMLGDKNALQKFDFAGFVRCLYRLVTDQQYIAQIKQEFILNNFDKMIQGDM